MAAVLKASVRSLQSHNPSIHASIHPSSGIHNLSIIHPFIHPKTVQVSTCPAFMYLAIHISVYLFRSYPFIYLPIPSSLPPSVFQNSQSVHHISVYLYKNHPSIIHPSSTHPSIHPYIHPHTRPSNRFIQAYSASHIASIEATEMNKT